MPIPLSVDAPDAVPEPLREAYIERDGKWVLDVEGLEDIERLKGALHKERQLHREAARKLASLEKQIDQGKTPEDDPRVDALRKQLQEYEEKLAEAQAAMARRDAEAALKQQALLAGVDPRHLPHLLKLIDGRWEKRGDDFVFVDENGVPTADDLGTFFAKRLPKEFPFFFSRSVAGSGAPHTGIAGGSLTREQVERMTPDEIRARWSDVKKALGG